MSQEKVKRVAGYIRVSTVSQATEGESLDVQRKQIEAHCKVKNWKLEKIYEDAGVSGSKAEKRKAFMDMSRDAQQRKFDIILFTKLSRFARNARDYYNFQHIFESHDVVLVSIKENIDPTSHNGRLMAGIFALLADWEREMIREQMTENRLVKWRDKRMFAGQPPYGYSWDKKKCIFIENKEESKVLILMLNWYVKIGISMKDVVIKLINEGYKSRRSQWYDGTVSTVFRNPCYGTCKLNTNTRVYVDGKRTNQLKDESEWIVFDLPRIVPKSLWNKVTEKRKYNIRKQKRTTWQQDSWLRDSLRCMQCGGRVHPKKGPTRKSGIYRKYYACFWGNCTDRELIINNRDRCIKTHLKDTDLEQYVWDYLTFYLTGNHANDEIEQELQEKAEVKFSILSEGNFDTRISDIEEKIVRLKTLFQRKELANKRILDSLEDDDISMVSLKTRLYENEQNLLLLKEQILDSENDRLELEELKNDRQSYLENKDILFSLWSDLQDFKPEDKKKMVESLVPDGIEVLPVKNGLGPDTVDMEIVWNFDIFQYFKEVGLLPSLGCNGQGDMFWYCHIACEKNCTRPVFISAEDP